MRHFLLLATQLVLAAAWAQAAASGASPWPAASSDLTPDPAVRLGTLPNGLRYAVMANPEPKGRASLRLLVGAGSAEEAENQRGLAHFVEHLAFSGSTHYPPGTLVQKLQRLGMDFGADVNANTFFDHTTYRLELPNSGPDLAEGLQIFCDYAGGLLLRPDMIDKERPIILSEKSARDSAVYRMQLALLNFQYMGTIVPSRLPIGLTEVIAHARRDRIADFYNTWYRPERMVVVAVGDFDPVAVEREIAEQFSALVARAPARPDPVMGTPPAGPEARVLYFPVPEAPAGDLVMAAVTPCQLVPDTADSRRASLVRYLAGQMLSQRLQVLAAKENSSISVEAVGVADPYPGVRLATIELGCKNIAWAAGLSIAEEELRRALQYGFQAGELAEVGAIFRNQLEQAVRSAGTRSSGTLADQLVQNCLDRLVFTAPSDDQKLLGPMLDQVTAADCAAALRSAWAGAPRDLAVTGSVRIDGSATRAVLAVDQQAQTAALAAPAPWVQKSWTYTAFGPPGKVAQRRHLDDIDTTLVTFANGVRLNLKRTDFERDSVSVNVRFGNGSLTEPIDRPGLAYFASQTFIGGGLGRYSVEDEREIFSAKTASLAFNLDENAFGFYGTTNRGDLLTELQLIAAEFSDPGFRPEGFSLGRAYCASLYTSYSHSPEGPFYYLVPRLLANGDFRVGLPPADALMARTPEEEKAWLGPQLAHGPIEITVVGDFDPEAAIEEVGRTLGELPAREPKPPPDPQREVSFPGKPFNLRLAVPSLLTKATVAMFWPTAGDQDFRRSAGLTLLARVLSDRLRIRVREQLGGSYSLAVRSVGSPVFRGFGYLESFISVDPNQTQPVMELMAAIAADMNARGLTEDEIERARAPVISALQTALRTNAYWYGALAQAQENPDTIARARDVIAVYQALTRTDLEDLAKAYLASSRAFRVTVLTTPPTP